MRKITSSAFVTLLTLMPMTLAKATAQSTGFISNVNIDGQGDVAYVQPSTDFNVSFDYQAWNGWQGGGGCIVYIAVGLGLTRDSLRTVYSPAWSCGVPGYFPGRSGSATVQTRTPTTMAPDTPYGIFFGFSEVSSASEACRILREDYRRNNGRFTAYGVVIRPSKIEEETQERKATAVLIAPNPSYSGAAVRFELRKESSVRINIYDVAGRLVRNLANEILQEGMHQFNWDRLDEGGKLVPSGAYTCEVTIDNDRVLKQIMTIR